jgi:hypothetical protein
MKRTEIKKDDEILREEAMTDGTMEALGIQFEPITALTVSWMQRNNIFDGDKDLIWRSAAFAFLHTEPKSKIRAVVNDRETFANAVDEWIEDNMENHLKIAELAKVMNEAFSRYTASISESIKEEVGKSEGKRKGRIG